MSKSIFLLPLLFLFSCSESDPPAAAQPNPVVDYVLHWNWVDDFSPSEQEKLQSWITQVYEATTKTMGQYPFDVSIYFHTSNSADSRAVTFGYATLKQGENQAHFYVNPAAEMDELLSDWIAPHELSHLAIPFIGKKNKWFTEGFATFFSRQIMMEMGQLSQAEFDTLYHQKIADTKKYYNSPSKTFIEVSDSLLQHHIYGSMYWGSAGFFMTIDERLRKEKGLRFIDVLQEYQGCCRLKDKSLKDILNSFDQTIGEPICANLMEDYRNKPSAEVMSRF